MAETDSDNDQTADCNDGCDNDPNKTAVGQCGCGVADTDSDNDQTPDCTDGCDDDPLKTAAGACGCGVADTDSDTDQTPDCIDGCDNDPLKTAAGACGCGVADTNGDGDVSPDCTDGCDNDPKAPTDVRFEPGVNAVVITATDASGNVATCETSVVVTGLDHFAIECPETLTLSAAADLCGARGPLEAELVASCRERMPVASDADSFPVGPSEVVFAVDEGPGRVATCTTRLVVTDEVIPEIDCDAPKMDRTAQLVGDTARGSWEGGAWAFATDLSYLCSRRPPSPSPTATRPRAESTGAG